MTKVIIVDSEAMTQDALFRSMKAVTVSKVTAMQDSLNSIADEREVFEANKERTRADGSVYVGQSDDFKHVRNLCSNESVARLFVSLKIDPRAYLYPQSLEGGKTSSQTSNLKAYKKTLEIAETIWTGVSTLENVVKVFTVCAWKASTMRNEVIERQFAETFLSSVEFRSIQQGSEDLWSAIDDVRAKHMTNGAQTQTSQAIRTLVALKSATDERNGRSKDVRIDTNGRVLNALMRRFGQITGEAVTA